MGGFDRYTSKSKEADPIKFSSSSFFKVKTIFSNNDLVEFPSCSWSIVDLTTRYKYRGGTLKKILPRYFTG